MARHGKKFTAAAAQVEERTYSIEEAIPLLQKVKFAKFDETIELTLRLGVDPKHADQMVRGTVVLPHGLGKSKKVLVIAGRRQAEGSHRRRRRSRRRRRDRREDHRRLDGLRCGGGDARHDAGVGRLGKVLGPRGLMPNPKTGTVTPNVAQAIKEIKAGKVEFRVDKTGIVHAPVGKMSFPAQNLDRQRPRAGGQRGQGQAVGGQGQVPEVGDDVVDDGSRRRHRHRSHRRALGGALGTHTMAVTRADKEQELQELTSAFQAATTAILVDYRGHERPGGHRAAPPVARRQRPLPRGEEHAGHPRQQGHGVRVPRQALRGH